MTICANYTELKTSEKKFGDFDQKIFILDNWDECFLNLMNFVNNEILPASYTLVDIGITVTPLDEGNKSVAFVLYDKTRVDSEQGKKLGMISRLADEAWTSTFEWFNTTIKSVGKSCFFKHNYCP